MTCLECLRVIDAYPCACGYQPKQLKVMQPADYWLIVTCATQGCDTAIRRRVGEHDAVPVCKWCKAGTSHAMKALARRRRAA
jgi:hypothetical protein